MKMKQLARPSDTSVVDTAWERQTTRTMDRRICTITRRALEAESYHRLTPENSALVVNDLIHITKEPQGSRRSVQLLATASDCPGNCRITTVIGLDDISAVSLMQRPDNTMYFEVMPI